MNSNLMEYPEANIIFTAEKVFFDSISKANALFLDKTGGLNDLDYKDLYELCKKNGIYESDIRIAEIGCWIGKTTIFLSFLSKGMIYAIDWFKGSEGLPSLPDKEIEDMLRKNLKTFGADNVKVTKEESVKASRNFPQEYLGLVFIDAEHNYENVIKDIDAWYPKVKEKGIISGHDFDQEGVEKAVKEKFKNFAVTKHGRIWYYRKEEIQ